MISGTVIGASVTGVLLFLSSVLVPLVTKRLNKANDAAASAEKLGTTAVNLATGMERRLKAAEKTCDKCVADLNRQREVTTKLLDAIVEVVPLLDADAESTKNLRAAVRTAQRARYDW